MSSGVLASASPLVSVTLEVIKDTYVEAMIIATAMLLYFHFARVCEPYVWGRRGHKDVAKGTSSKLAVCKTHSASEHALARSRRLSQPDVSAKKADTVRVFFSNLSANDSWKGSRDIVDQYEDIVRGCRSDLTEHLCDKEDATAAFAIIAEAVVVAADSHDARERVHMIFSDMRSFDFPRTCGFYTTVVKSLLARHLAQDVLWVYDIMVADGCLPDHALYKSFLYVALECHEDHKAISFFRGLCKVGAAPIRTYMAVLRILANKNDWRGAVDTLNSLASSGGTPDALALNTVLSICVSAGKMEIGVQLVYDWPKQADTVSCNILLKGFAKDADIAKSEVLLERMISAGPAPNIISFNTIIDCSVRAIQQARPTQAAVRTWAKQSPQKSNRGVRRAWAYVEQLEKYGLQPDRYTLSTLVKGMHLVGCSGTDIDDTVGLIRRVDFSSVGKDDANTRLVEVIFNSLLDACVNLRDLDRLSVVFTVMESCEVVVSAVTFGTLIKAFGHAGQLQACHDVWNNMRRARVRPTVVTYGCYLDACTRNKDLRTAEGIFKAMEKDGVKPNAVVYTTMIRGCAQSKEPLRALTHYQHMLRAGIEPTALTFNSMLDTVAKQLAHTDSGKLEEVIDDMQKADVVPDAVTYSILMKATCNAGHVSDAIALFRRMRTHGFAFDKVSFNTVLVACSKADKVKDAEEIFNDMLSEGTAPTLVTISILVKMYGKAKMLDKAIGVCKLMENKFGTTPNLHVFTCLVQACVRNRQLRKSWQVFGQMITTGVFPDAIAYGTVIHGCVYQNKFDEAMAFVRHAYGANDPAGSPVKSLASLLEISRDVLGQPEKPVVLQEEAMKMLSKALHRKGHTLLLGELEAILANSCEQSAATGGSWSTAGWRMHLSSATASSRLSEMFEDDHGDY